MQTQQDLGQLYTLPHGMGDRYEFQPIVPGGNFLWYEATKYGQRLPPDLATYRAIVRIASQMEIARKLLGPMVINSWYRPPDVNAAVGGVSNSRHVVGDGVDFWCPRIPDSGRVYAILDPIWPGGLGRYGAGGHVHLDARSEAVRWG